MKGIILNTGPAAWAFEDLANELAKVIRLDVSETPADLTCVLG